VKHFNWKQIFHWGGLGIGIIGVAFVIRKLAQYSNQIDFTGFSWLTIFSFVGFILVYFFANILLALAWRDLLQYLGVSTTRKWAIQTYGVSQIAKYVPGNIFQFAGRQAIGQAEGVHALPLAKSSVWEIGLLVTTGLFFSILVIPLFQEQVTYHLALMIFFIILFVSILCVYHWIGTRIALAMMWYGLFLIISGIVFNGVLMAVTSSPIKINSFFIGITGVYVVAWLAGLITPGAPAGIGVREMVFLAILQGVVSEGELLKAIVVGRFVTVGGDVLFYLFSMIIRFGKKVPIQSAPESQ